MSATSGRTSPPPFAYFDPDSASLRTCQAMFDLGLPTSSPTLPRSGSMRNGMLYQRPAWEPRTNVSASSSSPSLPTPRASEGEKGGPNQRGSKGDLTLSAVAAQLPTPAARDWRGGGQHGQLPTTVTTLPTPTVGDSRNSRNATANRTAPKATTNTSSLTLSDVAYLMPTPRTSDANGGGSTVTEAPTSVPQSPALLPTPNAYLGQNGGTQDPAKRRAGGHQPSIADVTEHLGAATPPPSTDGSR